MTATFILWLLVEAAIGPISGDHVQAWAPAVIYRSLDACEASARYHVATGRVRTAACVPPGLHPGGGVNVPA